MSALPQDLRHAIRSLARSPGWTLSAALILALAVAANTTVFCWVRSVLLEPVPGASDQGRLRVVFGRTPAGEPARFSGPDYRDLARRIEPIGGLLAQRWFNAALAPAGERSAERVSGALVSANYFDLLGARPSIGRGFLPGEDAGSGAPPVAVLGHACWERSFGADRSVLGRAVLLNGRPFTVVGVAPAGFFGSFLSIGADVFVPLAQAGVFDPAGDKTTDRGDRSLLCLARLAPGIGTRAAREALESEMTRLNHDYPGVHDGFGIGVVRVSSSPWGGPAELGPVVRILAALVALVLLIAAANVANLLFNRALGRRREIAVHLALGASRWRIARQMLVEGLGLAGLAAGAAALATVWTSGLLLAFIPPTGFPVRLDLGVDARVVAYAFAISFGATLLFSLGPSLAASRAAPAAELAAGAMSVTGTRGRARLRRGLVVAQIALSLVLLASAGLFLRSLAASRRLDPGFDTRRMLLVGLKLFPAGYNEATGAVLLDRLERRVRRIPQVRASAYSRRAPLGFGGFASTAVALEGFAPPPGEDLRVRFNPVSAGYFRMMGYSIRSGREFERSDRADTERVAIVNETFARRYLSGREAVGSRVRSHGAWRRIVGVAADGKYEKLSEAPLPFLFVPLAQVFSSEVELHVRTSGEPAAALPAVREALREVDPDLPPFEVQTMEQHLAEELFGQRVASSLLGAVGLLALLISGVGLYALAAHSVAERRREIGVRMALGATSRQLSRTFLAEALRAAVAGVALGLAAALAAGRLIAPQLNGIGSSDPLVFAATAALVFAGAVASAYFPASRAARLHPIAALRSE
jgi:putative ABC transport system permease protein